VCEINGADRPLSTMPSSVAGGFMSATLRDSIESEVHEIRRALRDSFRLARSDSGNASISSSLSSQSSHNSGVDRREDDNDEEEEEEGEETTTDGGGRLYTVLSTHLSDDDAQMMIKTGTAKTSSLPQLHHKKEDDVAWETNRRSTTTPSSSPRIIRPPRQRRDDNDETTRTDMSPTFYRSCYSSSSSSSRRDDDDTNGDDDDEKGDDDDDDSVVSTATEDYYTDNSDDSDDETDDRGNETLSFVTTVTIGTGEKEDSTNDTNTDDVEETDEEVDADGSRADSLDDNEYDEKATQVVNKSRTKKVSQQHERGDHDGVVVREFRDSDDSEGSTRKLLNNTGDSLSDATGPQLEEEPKPHHRHTVLYQQGATKLFRLIESRDWEEASHVLREHPDQAQIWVVSTETTSPVVVVESSTSSSLPRQPQQEPKTASWKNILWRRLPLHEAMRQQAPPFFVDRLLQVYSGACHQRTHFGELPLHLALDHGAAPATIHLILLHHIMAYQCTDQSGRLPLEIMNDAEVWETAEKQSLIRIFQSVQETVQEMQETHEKELKRVGKEHTRALVRETLLCTSRVDAEIKKQCAMEKELADMKIEMQAQKESFEAKFSRLENEKQELELSIKASQMAAAKTVTEMEVMKAAHQRETESLQSVLKRAVQWRSKHWTVVHAKLEESIRTFETLESTLLDHQDDLESLLESIGLEAVSVSPELVDSSNDDDEGSNDE
jgi:hypothetical protein